MMDNQKVTDTTRLTADEQVMAAGHIEFVIPRLTPGGYVEQTECAACHLTYPCDTVTALATIAALRARLARAERVVRHLEWISRNKHGYAVCPYCDQKPKEGHVVECIVKQALADELQT